MEIMLKNKCCLYVIISIRFFSITICNLLIEFPSFLCHSVQLPTHIVSYPRRTKSSAPLMRKPKIRKCRLQREKFQKKNSVLRVCVRKCANTNELRHHHGSKTNEAANFAQNIHTFATELLSLSTTIPKTCKYTQRFIIFIPSFSNLSPVPSSHSTVPLTTNGFKCIYSRDQRNLSVNTTIRLTFTHCASSI